jgi:predicted GH43/DUF377 family glycosyl hydrolase
VPWLHHRPALPPAGYLSQLDWLRSYRPSVLEEDDGTLRMWYSGHDGEKGRILEAIQEPGVAWRRVALSIDAPTSPDQSGNGNGTGVHSPSVVQSGDGYVMAYVESGSGPNRLRVATSEDGHQWEPQGTIDLLDDDAGLRVTDPSLVVTGDGWWLFYAGYDGTAEGRHAEVMAAVSTDGTAWDRIGTVLAPVDAEVAVSAPAVLVRQRLFSMAYVCDDGDRAVISLATSADGVNWDRRGTTLAQGPQAKITGPVHSPSTLHLRSGGLRLWYSTRTDADEADGCRIWSADFVKPPPVQRRVEGGQPV